MKPGPMPPQPPTCGRNAKAPEPPHEQTYIPPMPSQRPTPHTILMVVFPDFLLLDAAGPLQVFAMADQEAAKAQRTPRYRLRTVSTTGGLITSSTGLAVQTEALPRPASLQHTTLIVAGGDGTEGAMRDKRLIRWLQAASQQVTRCCSVCTGAFVLAQAGLLDGRRAVTHWQDVPLLRQQFQQVRLLDDAIHVRDGHVHTSAGVTAGIDLFLSLVQADPRRALSVRGARPRGSGDPPRARGPPARGGSGQGCARRRCPSRPAG